MKRPLLVLAFLPLAAGSLGAQAVPEGSQAARVEPAYRRTPSFRVDPFRHAMIPHWGFVFSAGATGENNTLNLADARAAIYLADNDSLLAGDVLDILGLIPEGEGLKGSALGEGGFYLGGPFGSHLSLGLSAQGRAYGGFQLDDDFVALVRDGNGARQEFSLGNTKGAALATAEGGAHVVLRFGPLGTEDGVNLNLGFGARYIKPIAFARMQSTVANGGRILISGDSVAANIGVELANTPEPLDSTLKNGKASIAGDFLVRLTWPTSGFALEAMVANVGNVTVHMVETERKSFNVATTNFQEFADSLDSFDSTSVKDTVDLKVKLPRIVRFTASAWANRFLQVDVSTTLPVHGDFESPLSVDIGTTWRLIRTLPLRAGLVLGGDQGIGFTGGLAIEGRNMFLQIMGQSLGGLFRNATGGGARVELGTFF
ncbi:MAG: hypothetical protein HYW06_04890 [Gemmatimonadetes bacterium]|nr:hypothetical protein [Gemmatimonadota bacterium]